MIKVIDKLFNGNISESENLFSKANDERDKKLAEAEEKINLLMETMNDKQKELFDAWRFADDGLRCDEVNTAYVRGFKSGAHLIIELYDFEI